MADWPQGWEARGTPPALFRRFEFPSYRETREFLDALAALSEEIGIHPQNINFGTTYVNVTLESDETDSDSQAMRDLAAKINALVTGA